MGLLDRLVGIWKAEQPLEQLPNPGLDRRSFLKILAGSAAVAAAAPMLDLEALIWTPTPGIVVPRAVPYFAVGDVFTIAGNYAVTVVRGPKPTELVQTNNLIQFVVTDVQMDTFNTHKGKVEDYSVQFRESDGGEHRYRESSLRGYSLERR